MQLRHNIYLLIFDIYTKIFGKIPGSNLHYIHFVWGKNIYILSGYDLFEQNDLSHKY